MSTFHSRFRNGDESLPELYEQAGFDTLAKMYRIFSKKKIGVCSVIARGSDLVPIADEEGNLTGTKIEVIWCTGDGTWCYDLQPCNMIVSDADPMLPGRDAIKAHSLSDYIYLLPEDAPSRIFRKLPATKKQTHTKVEQTPPPIMAESVETTDVAASHSPAGEERAIAKKRKKKVKQLICKQCRQKYYIVPGTDKITHGSTFADSMCSITK